MDMDRSGGQSQETCCSEAKQHLSEKESVARLAYLCGWILKEEDGKRSLAKYYKTPDFGTAVTFVQQVEILCRKFCHHPRIQLSSYEVGIFWCTHSVGGLTDLDFASAEACDRAFSELSSS